MKAVIVATYLSVFAFDNIPEEEVVAIESFLRKLYTGLVSLKSLICIKESIDGHKCSGAE